MGEEGPGNFAIVSRAQRELSIHSFIHLFLFLFFMFQTHRQKPGCRAM